MNDLYVPGEYACKNCGFTAHKMILDAHTGATGVDTRPAPLETCPNCPLPLEPVTWREKAFEFGAVLEHADQLRQSLFAGVPDLMDRRGIFSANIHAMKADPVAWSAVLGTVLVMRCEAKLMFNTFEYHAISPAFAPLVHGECAREYMPTITRIGTPLGGHCVVEWERM